MEKFKLHYSLFIRIKTIILTLFYKICSWLSAESKNILIAPFFFFFLYLILFRSITLSSLGVLVSYVLLIPCYYFYLKPNFKRYSNNTILNNKRRILNMSIKNIKVYHQFSYINKRNQISEILIEEFVEGIVQLYNNCNYDKFTLSTHEWIIENIFKDPRVSALFKYEIESTKQKSIRSEIFPLVTWSELLKFDGYS